MNRIARPVLQEIPLLRGFPLRQASTARPKPPAPPSLDWPWRSIGSNTKTGEIVQERTIYARPTNFSPRMLWLVMAAMVPGCFLAADTVHMKVEWDAKVAALESEQAASTTTETSNSSGTIATTASDAPSKISVTQSTPAVPPPPTNNAAPSPFDDLLSLESVLSGFLLTCGGAISVLVLFYPTRVIRRVSQIRSIPASQLGSKPSVVAELAKLSEPSKTRVDLQKGEQLGESWIRVETAAERMWAGRWGLPRDVRTERVRPGLIRGGTTSSPYLRLSIEPNPSTWFSLDGMSYRLDFRRLEDRDYEKKQDEVVVSWKRLEHVFGEVV